MLRALIIDDEAHARKELQSCLQSFIGQLEVIGEAGTIEDGIAGIKQLQPDLVFLDVEMPGGTGFNVLEAFDHISFEVIFVTGHDAYAIKAFKHSAIDYLLKPVVHDELAQAIQKVMNTTSWQMNQKRMELMMQSLKDQHFNKLAIPGMDCYEFIDKKDIIHCQADGNYTHLYLANGRKITSTIHLRKLEDILTDPFFFRVHKSDIININFINKVLKGEGGQVVMENGETIPIARRRKDAFFQILNMR